MKVKVWELKAFTLLRVVIILEISSETALLSEDQPGHGVSDTSLK